jgi:hypothetical protein
MPLSFGATVGKTAAKKKNRLSIPVTDSLVAYFDANDPNSYPGAGAVWQDLSSNKNAATLNSTIVGYANRYGGHLVMSADATNTPAQTTLSSALTTNTFTIMAWINPRSTQSAYAGIVIDRSVGNNGTGLQFSGDGNTTLRFIYNGTQYTFNTGIIVPANQWSLVTLVVTASNITPYINGTAGNVYTAAIGTVPLATLRLGWDNGAARVFQGKYGAALLYNKSLSAAEVSSMYDYFKTRYIVAGTNLKLHIDAGDSVSYSGSGTTWSDISGSNNNVTLNTTPTYSDGKLTFAESTYGTVANGSSIIANSPYTKSVWVKFNNLNGFKNLISGNDSSPHAFWGPSGWEIYSNKFLAGHNSTWTHIASTTTIETHKWYNVTVTFSTTNGFNLYVNGQLEATNSSYKTNFNHSGGPLFIGSYALGSNGFNGQLASAFVYNKELTASEVTQNYNAGKSQFYTEQFPANISGLELWLKADAGIFDINNNAITADSTGLAVWQDQSVNRRNIAQTDSTKRPLVRTGVNGVNGRAAVSFDGVDDVIYNSWSNYNTNKPFTIFHVVNYSTFGDGTIYTYGLNNATGAQGDAVRFLNSSGRKLRICSNAIVDTTNFMPPSGTLILTFQHNGVAGSAGTFTIRNNGLQIYQASLTRSASVADTWFSFGTQTNGTSGPFAGKICEHLYFSKTLNTKEIKQVESYLNARWNAYNPVIADLLNEAVFHINSTKNDSYPGSGATWFDISSSANHVTLSGNYSYNAITSGIKFVGGDAMGSATSLANIPTGNTNRTVIAYCKTPTDLSAFLKHIVHWGVNSTAQSWGLATNANNLGAHRWGSGGASATANLATNTTYGLAVSYNNTTGQENFYRNGEYIGSQTPSVLYTGSNELRIGSRITGPSENWSTNGEIYVVLIFPRCLSDAEIQSIHAYYKTQFGLS